MKKSFAETLYFWDGTRKIDLVLAYEATPTASVDGNTSTEEQIRQWHRKRKREYFEQKLLEKGLELELEPSQVIKRKVKSKLA